jgi:hypothetical protein
VTALARRAFTIKKRAVMYTAGLRKMEPCRYILRQLKPLAIYFNNNKYGHAPLPIHFVYGIK